MMKTIEVRTAAAYLWHGISSAWETAMIWPPSDPFVQHIRGKMGKDVGTILNLGCGPGVLEMELLRNNQPTELCVSVDCNTDFLRLMNLNLREMYAPKERRKRIRSVYGRAENVGDIIGEHFGKKKIDWLLISFSVKVVGREVTRQIIQTIQPHLSGKGGGMIWNYLPTNDVMETGFRDVTVDSLPCWSLLPMVKLQLCTGRDAILSAVNRNVNGADYPDALTKHLLSQAHPESSPDAPLPSGT